MPPEPIAIIGVSTELPSGQENVNLDFHSFWPFLLQKGEAYSPIPQDRFNHDAWVYSSSAFIKTNNALGFIFQLFLPNYTSIWSISCSTNLV